jgi:3-oxoacyl-(acyl-carrier-protein) synthase III
MKPYVLNRHGRLFFPSNFFPSLDFSVFSSLEQLEGVIRRDFEAKAPTGTEILDRVTAGGYADRYELLRDLALNLMWVNRYAITMYDKRPTRWRDVPRHRDDVFLPILTPWEEGDRKVAAVEGVYRGLAHRWGSEHAEAEDRIFRILFDVFRYRRHHATELPAVKATVAEILADPSNRTFHLPAHDPDYPTYSYGEVADCAEDVAELEALLRQAMVLHNQYPWDRAKTRLSAVGELGDDDFVVCFHPRNREVAEFILRVKGAARRPAPAVSAEARQPVTPLAPVVVPEHFATLARIEALAAVEGEHTCDNEDLIRNAAYNWSPMSAAEIREKTGIEQRRYTQRNLEDLALQAARAALEHAGRGPDEIGAVLLCTCTSTKLIPSMATWLSGQLGMYQTHASCDIVAACAGLPYGLAEALRQLQEVRRPVLLVCAEKFSDKIGSVRTSRMIFGDGAAALVVAPSTDESSGDVEVVQTYASGPMSEVDSIIWPNPDFDNDITVYGPEVKALVARYLEQMLGELTALPGRDGQGRSVLETVDLIVPHQANRTMVTDLAQRSGLSGDQLYFNIDRVGNTSSASIPLALHDAVRDGVLSHPMRVFAPGFGAGAVGGYAVLRLDPAVVAPAGERARREARAGDAASAPVGVATSSDDVRAAFG